MVHDLAKRVLNGDMRAAARLLTLIEDGATEAAAALKLIYPRTGNAHIVGVTGPPGTGKSTLIAQMILELRRRGKKVGILAIDPSSPFSGGAFLGDRVRMRDHFLDDDVFIRSFASRGSHGGLSAPVREAIHLLDAMGKEIIIIETLGVGQDELEVSTLAHTVIVVLAPWMGDEIQAMKAGLLEIADILIVNKSDLPGAARTVEELKSYYEGSHIRLLETSALKGEGLPLVVQAVEQHRERIVASGDHVKKSVQFSRWEVLRLLREKLLGSALKRMGTASVDELVKRVAEREVDPYTAAERIARRIRRDDGAV
jgi:LAO/AO transport system kinase